MSGSESIYIIEILRLEPLLRASLHRFASTSNDLDDLTQETYSRLLALSDADRAEVINVQAFALTTARNVAVDWTRRCKTVPFDLVEDLDALPVLSDVDSVERIVNAHQELSRLAQAVAELPVRCGEVFTLRKVYGLSQQEIAHRLGVSVKTVEAHLVKAVKRCREHTELLQASEKRTIEEKRTHWPWKGHR